MSDTINALSQAQHSSTVLQGIMNPAQINPLSGYGNAITLVSGMQGLQAKQGEQLVGNALQQATDPDSGIVDYQKAQKIAAGMGPSAAYAMQGFLKTGSQLTTEQQVQASNHFLQVASIAPTIIQNPSDANVNMAFDNYAQSSHLPKDQIDQERQRWLAMSPTQRQQAALQYGMGSLDALNRMHYGTGGAPITLQTGGTIQGASQNPIGGAITPSGQPTQMTLTPGEATGLDKIDIGKGATIQVPHALVPDLLKQNPSWRAIVGASTGAGPGSASSTAPPPPPANATIRSPGAYNPPGGSGASSPAAPAAPAVPVPGGPGTYPGPGFGVLPSPAVPGPGASLGGGVPVASANQAFAPTVGSAAPPSPAVVGDVNAIIAGMNQGRAAPRGGTQQAFNALQSGAAPAPSQPPAASTPPAPEVAPAPTTPTLGISSPFGTKETLEGRATASVAMANAMHAQASQSPQRQALLADMDATNRQINSGPNAEAATKWSAFVNQLPENVSSLIPGMSREQVAGAEGFAKLAETFRQMQAGGIAGTLTNDKFASALASNPHLALSTLGNQGMIHLLQGSEDALQYKDRAWIAASGANPSQDYQAWETNFNKSFDPRVFWWGRMERPEQQRLMGGMGEQQKQTLLAHLKQAAVDGLISRPGGQGG